MKIEIIGTGMGPILSNKKLDELFFGTSTINKKSPLEEAREAMDKIRDAMKRGEAKTIILDSFGDIAEEIEKNAVGKYSGKPICFDIQSITANHKKNAFTVVWGDGSHTIIHLQKGDVWDDEKALAMCFIKHMMGDKGSFNDIFTKEMPAKIKHIGKVEPVEEKINVSNKEKTEKTEYGRREEGLKPAVEKLIKTCEKAGIDLKRAGEAANDSAKATITLNDSLTSMLEKFLSNPTPVYDVFVKENRNSKQIMVAAEKKVISKYLKVYVQKHYPTLVGTPWRIWTVGKEHPEMYIDFGASEYFVIPGMTCEEWNKNN